MNDIYRRSKMYFHLLPILIMAIASIYTIYVTATTEIVMMDRHYVGVLGVILCLIL